MKRKAMADWWDEPKPRRDSSPYAPVEEIAALRGHPDCVLCMGAGFYMVSELHSRKKYSRSVPCDCAENKRLWKAIEE